MYALSVSAEGDCYRCVPPDQGIAAAALRASESGTLPGTAPAKALHAFTLDFGASRCFFRDSTTLTPLPAPVPVRLADPSGGPVVARSSTVLPCPAVPSGSLSVLHLPSFSTNLRVSICTSTRTGRHLATFTRRPGSSLYTLATAPSQVAASAQVSASGQVAASCSCRLLSHQTLLWHHRLGHPSLPRLRGMHSRLLVSGLPRSLPPLPPSPALPCLPCVEGRQRTTPHSSFPPTTAPLQTLHMDVKGQVVDVLIPWIRTVRLQLRERSDQDLPVLRLHSDRGGEFSSNLLREFCRGEGILQSFTLLDSPRQNGIAERRIGLVMDVARTSMIYAAAPHFLWPFAVRYAVHQLNLWPCVSLPKTSPTLRWTGEVGDASVFQVWGSHAFVRDMSADKLSPHAIPCNFLGFVPDALGWQFFPSQDVTFDESVPFYRLFPYRSAPPPPLPLFLAPDPLLCPAPVQVAVDSGAARGAMSGGAKPGGAESEGAETRGAEAGGVELRGAEPGGAAAGSGEPGGASSEGAESGGAEPQGATSSGGSAHALLRLSPQQLREWFVWRTRLRSGVSGAGGAGAARAGGTRVAAGAGVTGGTATAGTGGARTRGTGAAGTGGVEGAGAGDLTESGSSGVGGAGAGGAGVGGPGVGGAGAGGARAVDPGGPVRPRPYFLSLLRQPSGGLTERREPASRPALPVRTARRVPRLCPPPVPGTHAMTLRPSSVPLRVPLLAPPESSLPDVPDPESDRARAASPTVSHLLATTVTDPSFESAAASALVAELLDFAAACRLDYASALVAESASASPPSVGGECALGTDVLEDRLEDLESLAAAVPRFASMLLAPEGDPDAPDIRTPRSYVEAITGPYSSQWQAAMDAKMASWKVKQPPGSLPAFKAHYIARGFSQRQGVDFFHTFSPTPKMTTLRVFLHFVAQRDNELHSLDFSTAFLQGSLHEEIWLRHPPGFKESFPAGTQWSLRRPVYSLCQALTLVKSELQKRHTCTDLARELPLQPLAPPRAALSPPLQPRMLPVAARSPPLGPPAAPRPANRPSCSLRAATCSPLAAPCCCLPCSLRCPALARPACCAAVASLRVLVFDHEGRPIQFDTWLDDLQLTAQALYDAVVARYSSPATAALGRLLLPYLFPELSAFATVEDLVTHLRTSNACYRAALPAEFLERNPPLMDHILSLDPTALTVDLLEQHLLAAETSVVAVGTARGTPRTPFFEGCSPSPLAPFYASATAVDVLGAEDVGAASASGKRRSSKGKGGKGGGGGSGGGGRGNSGGGGGSGGGGSGGSGGGVGALVAAMVAAVGVAVAAAVGVVAVGLELFPREVVEVARGSSSSVGVRPHRTSSFTCGKPHTKHRLYSRLDDAWRAKFGDEAKSPRWAELLRSEVSIFDLDYDAILAAMYALSVSAEGDCYLRVPPDPGIEVAALGASESALPGTAPT
ncbi:unnamed protein product [Closterium sp. NIES-53]